MISPLIKLYQAARYLLYGADTCSFNDGERLLLTAVERELSDEERATFNKQIESVFLVQRPQSGRMSISFYRKRKLPGTLPYPGYEHHLAEVKYEASGKSRKAWVVLHDGRIQTIEGAVPYGDDAVEQITAVRLHPRGIKSVAEIIDTEEHGRSKNV